MSKHKPIAKARAVSARKTGLAPLASYEPEKIVAKQGRQRLAEFILALAVAFNDLKGLLLWRESLLPNKPVNQGEVSERAGEWYGTEIQIHRLLIAHLHELLKLIEEYKAEATGADIRRILSKAHPSTRHHWDDLVRIATNKGTAHDARFAEILVATRNNAAYHYYQAKPLVAGFRKHFFESEPAPFNKVAFASVGVNMEETRFYFADAAIQATLVNLVGRMGTVKFNKRLIANIEAVNQALDNIITGQIETAKLP